MVTRRPSSNFVAGIVSRDIDLTLRRERLELPDGDFIDLDWYGEECQGQIVIVMHGLEGSIDSHYAKGLMRALHQSGFRPVFMHFRGCSEEHNRLDITYHFGFTTDFNFLVKTLRDREPETLLSAVGISLGGNVLLKWLGETTQRNTLHSAVAVGVPFLLKEVSNKISRGFSRIYQASFVKSMKRKILSKYHEKQSPVDTQAIPNLKTIWQFDEYVTAPLFGFKGADDYYQQSSSRQYLKNIQSPTLIIHAKNDPFMTPEVIPDLSELSPYITFELSQSGGHVGFISGWIPGRAEYWLEQRIPEFIQMVTSCRLNP